MKPDNSIENSSGDILRLCIAGLPFEVHGEALTGLLHRTPGFGTFMRPSAKPGEEPPAFIFRHTNPVYDPSCGEVLHYFETEGINCAFVRTRVGYAFSMWREGTKGGLSWIFCEGSDEIFVSGTPDGASLRFSLWMAYGLIALQRQTVSFHSSAIVYGERAVLFLGESGTGKSTHTRLWREHVDGSFLLNDDSPFVRIEQGKPVACGSPWSGKTPCYRDQSYPVAAVVRLSQGPENRMRRLSGAAALGAMLPSCPPSLAYDETTADGMMEILSAVIASVPVFHMECRPDREAARMSFETIFSK